MSVFKGRLDGQSSSLAHNKVDFAALHNYSSLPFIIEDKLLDQTLKKNITDPKKLVVILSTMDIIWHIISHTSLLPYAY